MNTEMKVILRIMNFVCDHDELSKILGARPKRIGKKGEPLFVFNSLKGSKIPLIDRSGKQRRRIANEWEFEVRATTKYSLEKLVQKLFKAFKSDSAIKKAVTRGEGALICVLYTSDREADLTLSPATLARIAKIGCEFGIDYYWLPDRS